MAPTSTGRGHVAFVWVVRHDVGMGIWVIVLTIVALSITAAMLVLLVGTAGCRSDEEDERRYEAAVRNRKRGGLEL